MSRMKSLLLAVAMLFVLSDALAQSPPAMRIRGAVTAFDGHELQVRTRGGSELKMGVDDDTKVSILSAIRLSDVRQGSFVGVTAVRGGPGGSLLAREVHLFPEELRGTGEGHRDWDLEPGSTMTNADVEAVVNAIDGEMLTLVYKGGSQKVFVPKDVPVVTFSPADRSLLKAGAHVFIIAQRSVDGRLTAQRIQVGKDGLKPPM